MRPMTIEEKGKLTQALQSLPPEKMDHVLQIVRKRNGDLVQHDDEIELDFEVMDTETLWELDRFVGNCKKMMSKIKRQEAMANDMISGPLDSAPNEADDKSPMAGETPDWTTAKRIKKVDPGDENVDIGEEMPPSIYPMWRLRRTMLAVPVTLATLAAIHPHPVVPAIQIALPEVIRMMMPTTTRLDPQLEVLEDIHQTNHRFKLVLVMGRKAGRLQVGVQGFFCGSLLGDRIGRVW